MASEGSVFRELLKTRLGPVLCADGFARIGKEWQRIVGPLINCLNVQNKSDNAACCVNLGVHLAFLPTFTSSVSGSKPIDPADCEISDRLCWEGEPDHWWPYADGERAADDLVACYERRGRDYFALFARFPRPFVDVELPDFRDKATTDLFPMMTKVRKALLLARVHDHLGNAEKAVEFSRFGESIAGRGLKPAFEAILRKHGRLV